MTINPNSPVEVARAAVATALARAGRHAATAAVAAGLTTLGAMPASATIALPTYATITGTTFQSPIGPNETFKVTNTTQNFNSNPLIEIEIPEITAGDLIFTPASTGETGFFIGSFSDIFLTPLPAGWSATEVTKASIRGSGVYGSQAAAYVDLITAGTGIAPGASLSFTAAIPTLTTTNAAFGLSFAANTGGSGAAFFSVIDPPIPNTTPTVSAVPEPMSAVVLAAGLTGLVGLRRRMRS